MVEHNLAKVGVAGSTPVSRSILLFVTLLFLSLPNVLYASVVSLKSHYFVQNECVPPETFGITDSKKRCLLTLEKKRTRWRIPLFKIKEILSKEGYAVESPKTGMITFERMLEDGYGELQHLVADAYKKSYPTIRIRSVTVKPTSSKYEKFHYDSQCNFKITKSSLHRKSGTFIVVCGRRHHFFRYDIKADIGVYKANHQIKKDKMIVPNGVIFVTVPFERMNDAPVANLANGDYIARQNISSGKIITQRMVAGVPAVKKNERVLCIYEDGAVHIEFEATAMQNGYIGDNITLKKSDGRSIHGVVLDKKRVEIR